MKVFLKILFCIFTMLIITVGEVKSSTVAEKLIHLAADNASISDIENALSSKNFEYQKDASVESGFMVDTEKQYKGWAATQIFSPEIVGEILFMSLGTGSSAERVAGRNAANTAGRVAVKKGAEVAAKGESNVLLNTSRQLQAKFKHAGDFGVMGSYSKANAAKFSSAINQHINSAGVQIIQGTYRGQSVIHYVNPNTGLNVISTPSGQFWSGWKLSPAQLQNVLKHGGL